MGRLEDADQDTGHGTGKVSGDLVTPDPPPTGRPPAWRSSGGDRARSIARVVGELLITFGLVTLLFVVYEIYWTDLISAGKQRDATAQLDNQWGKPDVDPDTLRRNHFEGLGEGDSFAKLYVPTFGPDYHFTIIEGTSEKVLAIGPGHYTGYGLPRRQRQLRRRGPPGRPRRSVQRHRPVELVRRDRRRDARRLVRLPGAPAQGRGRQLGHRQGS